MSKDGAAAAVGDKSDDLVRAELERGAARRFPRRASRTQLFPRHASRRGPHSLRLPRRASRRDHTHRSPRRRAEARASALVRDHETTLRNLARELMAHETIDGAQLRAAAGAVERTAPAVSPEPVAA